MEDRMTELEVKLAYADDLLDGLNRTVFRQQAQIDRLEREVRELREMLNSLPLEQRSLRDDIPPHY